MLQYIPKNWPYDHVQRTYQKDKACALHAGCALIAIRKQAVTRPKGDFKAGQMARFGKMRMKGVKAVYC